MTTTTTGFNSSFLTHKQSIDAVLFFGRDRIIIAAWAIICGKHTYAGFHLCRRQPVVGSVQPEEVGVAEHQLAAGVAFPFRHLLFLLLDQHNDFPPPHHTPVSKELVRHYISEAWRINPYISKETTETVIGVYIHMRDESNETSKMSKKQTYTSALLAQLRLATAHARLRISDEVHESDIIEAVRHMHQSKASLDDDDDDNNNGGGEENFNARIFEHIKRLAGDDEERSFIAARRRAIDAGHNPTEKRRKRRSARWWRQGGRTEWKNCGEHIWNMAYYDKK